MSSQGLISVITIDYNGLEVTRQMLRSLSEHVSMPLEVIVVDNASAQDEAAILREEFPWAKVVRSERNLGFAGGNNLGMQYATGDYLLFLNNDTEIFEDTLHCLAEAFDKDPQIGIVCPKIRFFHGERLIQYAGYTDMKGIAMKCRKVGCGKADDGLFDAPGYTFFPHGCAMMTSRRALQDVGPMPEDYFLFYEELDWGMMMRRKGWKIWYEPSCTIFHKESVSTGADSPLRRYYMARGRQLFAWRNFKGAKRLLAVALARYGSGGKKVVLAALKGRWDLVEATIRGNRDFVKMIRGI